MASTLFNTPLMAELTSVTLRPHQTFIYNYDEILEQMGGIFYHQCGHRRMGKTVGIAERLRKSAVRIYKEEKIFNLGGDVRSNYPRLVFFAETQKQARDIIWQELALRMSVFRDVDMKVRDLVMRIPRPHIGDYLEIMIKSLRHHNSVRGMKFREIFIDEAQFLSELAFKKSILATLTDSWGTGVTTGTAVPDGYYKEMLKEALANGQAVAIIPVTHTDSFDEKKIRLLIEEMGVRAFRQEYMCDFNIPNKGAFFCDKLLEAERSPGFFGFKYDPALPLLMGVDVGIGEGMAVWLGQVQGNRLYLMDYFDGYESGMDIRKDVDEAVRLKLKKEVGGISWDLELAGKEVQGMPYMPDYIATPHDMKNRKLGVKQAHTVYDVFKEVFPKAKIVQVARPTNKMTMITNANDNLHLLGFPGHSAGSSAFRGLQKLKNYGRVVNDRGVITDQIDKEHGYDHAADSLMTLMEWLEVRNGNIGRKDRLHKRDSRPQESDFSLFKTNPRLSYIHAQLNRDKVFYQ